MLTVGDLIEVKVVDVDYNGQGVIKHEGYVIFVKGLLKDEVAKIKITKLRKNFGEGILFELVEKSKDRFYHPQSILGSCDLLHMSKDEQLMWQEKTTKETLLKIAGLSIDVEQTITDNHFFNYRNKSVFHVMDKPYLSLGLYHKDDHRLIEVTSFILSDTKTNEILNHLNQHKIIVDSKVFKHVIIRTNPKGEALITIVSLQKKFKGLDKLITHLLKLNHIKGITLNLSLTDGEILGPESIVLYGENRLIEPLNDKEVYINDRSFFQVNHGVSMKVYELVHTHLLPHSTVLDAYSGVGSIGFYIEKKAKHVIMIESNKASHLMALETKDKYQLDHIDLVLNKTEEVIDQYSADVLIVDPPRNGLMPLLLQKLETNHFKQVFYLSCDAKTLARDLQTLTKLYKIDAVYPIRMFYHTTSLETLVILSKK